MFMFRDQGRLVFELESKTLARRTRDNPYKVLRTSTYPERHRGRGFSESNISLIIRAVVHALATLEQMTFRPVPVGGCSAARWFWSWSI